MAEKISNRTVQICPAGKLRPADRSSVPSRRPEIMPVVVQGCSPPPEPPDPPDPPNLSHGPPVSSLHPQQLDSIYAPPSEDLLPSPQVRSIGLPMSSLPCSSAAPFQAPQSSHRYQLPASPLPSSFLAGLTPAAALFLAGLFSGGAYKLGSAQI